MLPAVEIRQGQVPVQFPEHEVQPERTAPVQKLRPQEVPLSQTVLTHARHQTYPPTRREQRAA